MSWSKKKLIFKPDGQDDIMFSHAQLPTPLHLKDELYRIYFTSRDRNNKSRIFYLDYDFAADQITHLETSPVLDLGIPGTFDDNGVVASSALRHEGKVYLYYFSWNIRSDIIPYHISIGLAISEDEGRTFARVSEGPVMDRAIDEPYFNSAPFVMKENNIFHMWYLSATGWNNINGKMEPVYSIRHAQSKNGLDWRRDKGMAIPFKKEGEAITRPWVMGDADSYKMWYSYRGSQDFRKAGGEHYMIGFAQSPDAKNWTRRDEHTGIEKSISGWDSEMIEYCAVIEMGTRQIMLYNGNGFGQSGFGYAERPKS